MTILLTRSGDRKHLGLGFKEKLAISMWTNSNFDEEMLKDFLVQWLYIQETTTPPVPDISFSNCFSRERV